jgi:small-conductance mechanosensitive channel
METVRAEPSGETAVVTLFNRPIVSLRARVLGRSPQERATAAERILDDLVAQQMMGPVDWQPLAGGSLISVGSRGVLVLMPPDIDALLGETLPAATAQAVARLQQALTAAAQGRAPGMLLRSVALALLGLVAGLAAVWGVARANGALSRKLESVAERTIAQTGIADIEALRASRLVDLERRLLKGVVVIVDFAVIYVVITFVLRRFPYTSPWGESMRGFLLATLQNLGLGILGAMPGLFTVFLIFMLARFLARLIGFWFRAVEGGRVKVRWIYPETAQPTRRLLTALLWLFAVVMAYPYLPGSGTDAFKGMSVFLGLMLTFGSSGLVNQVMSGFMVTYSRALRLGDLVRIGDVEGTVTHLGVLSTKIRTPFSEEVTVPNAVVVAQTTTDYSRLADSEGGVFTPTSVTIGYDAPWRQVQSLLLLAAERTPGLRQDPKPMVLQAALEDFYVRYTLLVGLERQESRPFTLHALHSHIQDLFNEYGVQIMSPNYFLDPAAPKVVAKKDWFAAPASPDPSRIVPSVRHLT